MKFLQLQNGEVIHYRLIDGDVGQACQIKDFWPGDQDRSFPPGCCVMPRP